MPIATAFLFVDVGPAERDVGREIVSTLRRETSCPDRDQVVAALFDGFILNLLQGKQLQRRGKKHSRKKNTAFLVFWYKVPLKMLEF